MPAWRELPTESRPVPAAELSLPHTLDCGQAFRWRRQSDGAWVGVIGRQVFRLRRTADELQWQAFPASPADWTLLARYLRLVVCLADTIELLARGDEPLAAAVTMARGLRVAQQEPTETLCSYICSAANSVPRISRAIETLAAALGVPIGVLDGVHYYAFPAPERLADTDDSLLDAAGLGFRGRNLRAVAQALLAEPIDWPRLRAAQHLEARDALASRMWVGPKIADCVCLFALGHDIAVPVDTHIWALAKTIFGAEIQTKSLTAKTYQQIHGLFVRRYGRYAGWAQQYLFHWRRITVGRASADADG